MKTIYRPKLIYTNDKFYENYAVVIEDRQIIEVGQADGLKEKYHDAEKASGWERLIMVPGTVNIHNHCFQSLLRGLSCDRPFL